MLKSLVDWLRQEGAMVKQAPIICLLCAIIGAFGAYLFFSERLSVMSARVDFWKDRANTPGTPPTVSSKPNFRLSALGADVFVSSADATLTGVALHVQIRNAGTASIASDWALTVIPNGREPVVAQYTTIPSELKLTGQTNTVIKASDSLAEKVSKQPIQAGASPVQGRVLFYVRLPRATVLDGSTVLRLAVQDIAGVEFSIEQRVGDWIKISAQSGTVESPNASTKAQSSAKVAPANPATPPSVANNCPNGICITGGTVTNPTVNNFAPIPKLSVDAVYKNQYENGEYVTLYSVIVTGSPIPRLSVTALEPSITFMLFAKDEPMISGSFNPGEDPNKPRTRTLNNVFGSNKLWLRTRTPLTEQFQIHFDCTACER